MRSSVDERPLLDAVDEGVLTLTLDRPKQRKALVTRLVKLVGLARAEEALLAARERREPEFTGR